VSDDETKHAEPETKPAEDVTSGAESETKAPERVTAAVNEPPAPKRTVRMIADVVLHIDGVRYTSQKGSNEFYATEAEAAEWETLHMAHRAQAPRARAPRYQRRDMRARE
jgi:hypothetical protein